MTHRCVKKRKNVRNFDICEAKRHSQEVDVGFKGYKSSLSLKIPDISLYFRVLRKKTNRRFGFEFGDLWQDAYRQVSIRRKLLALLHSILAPVIGKVATFRNGDVVI